MKNLIVDGSNLLYRIYFAWGIKVEDPEDLSLVESFLICSKHYVESYKPDNIYIAWDRKLTHPSTNFRKEAAEVNYKGTRDYSKTKHVHDHDDLIMGLLDDLGANNIYPNVMEADDVMSWLSEQLPGHNIIVSTDRDMWQLVNEKVSVYDPMKKVEININNFNIHSPVPIEQSLIYKCFIGDASDNIPGVQGIGQVRAKRLLEDWDSRKETLTEAQLDRFNKNMELMDLKHGYTVHEGEIDCYKEQLDNCVNNEPDFEKFKTRCEESQLYSLSSNLSPWKVAFSQQSMENGINSLIQRLNLDK
jgi:DNA polymerase-1